MKLGMNLTPALYWSDDFPFLDRMRCAGDWGQGKILRRDANDWPTTFDGPRIACQVPMDDKPTEFMVRWKGKGTFKLSVGTVTARGDGWMTAVCALPDAAEKSSNQIMITAIDPADPLRDISVVAARHDALHQSGEVFDPAFLESLRGYGQIRFMDWMRTNEQAPHPTMTQRSWFWGVPLGVCLDLAARIGARAWINLPAQATDDEIRAFGRTCPPDADIEDANEVWNTGFKIGKQVADEATNAKIDKGAWIARRQARIAKLLESVGRKLVVGYQPTTKASGWDKYGAALIEAGATSRNVSRVMTTCYPTGGINSLPKITLFMAADDVAGAIALIRQDAIDNSGARFAVTKALADKIGVPWSVYEGNAAHLNTSAGSDAAVPFVAKVQMHPGMREIGEIILTEAERHGCDVFNVFNHSSPATRNGFFGVKGTPFGALLDERRISVPEPTPLTLEERVSLLERQYATLSASINGGLK